MQEFNPDMMPVGELKKFDNTDDLSEQLDELLKRGNSAVIYQEGSSPVLVKSKKKVKKSGFYNSRKSIA